MDSKKTQKWCVRSGIVSFEMKAILDKLDDDDKVEGKIGEYLRKYISETLTLSRRSSKTVQLSERLYDRFEEQLNNKPFVYDKTAKTYILESIKYCEGLERGVSVKAIVNSTPLWHGTQNIMETKTIRDLLIKAYCSDQSNVDFSKLFEYVKKKVQDWLVNSPLSIDSYIAESDEDKKIEIADSLITTDNPLENSTHTLELERVVKEMVDKFDETEITLINEGLYNGRTLEEIGPLINLGRSATGERLKKVKEKMAKEFNLITNKYQEEFELEEIADQFNIEIGYLNLEPENV